MRHPSATRGQGCPFSIRSAMVPDKIDQYQITGRLGAGAFGVVFRAVDTVLGRPAVIKLLRAGSGRGAAREQILEEARMVSAIEHANVCAIYGVGEFQGQPYIAMQFAPGQTLDHLLERGPLSLQLALSVGIQIANGLAAAHRMGVLHRDLKPEHVMVAEDGGVKILDFGLARRTDMEQEAGGAADEWAEQFGTTAYMAPEQLALHRSSEQSDIFALGVILYEMLTAQHPFRLPGADPGRVVRAIRTRPPARPTALRPDLPEDLSEIVLRALAKQPAGRFQHAADLAEALKTVMRTLELEVGLLPGESSAELPAPAPEARERTGLLADLVERFRPARAESPAASIAVLPFRDLESRQGSRLHGVALSNAVATRLARIPGLLVRPLSAYLAITDQRLDPLEAGSMLDVERVLQGSFAQDGERLVVQWELLEVATRAVAAGGSVVLDQAQPVAAQDRVAEEILAALMVSGSLPAPSLPARPERTLDELPLETRTEFLRARALLAGFALRSGTLQDFERLRDAYQRVAEQAPDFAPAHAGLGTAYLRSARTGLGGVEHLRAAERHLTRALELDPELVEARLYRASTLIWAGHKDSARLELQQLLVATPPDAEILLAAAVILQLDGLLDEALRLQGAALLQNPAVAPRVYYYRSRVLTFQGKRDRARAEIEEGLVLEPGNTMLRYMLGLWQLLEGQVDAAIATLEAVLRDAPTLRIAYPTLAVCHAHSGRRAEADALITAETLDAAAADAETAYRLASYWAATGREHHALSWFRRAIYLGNENYPWFVANPIWEPLRQSQELQEILAELREVHRVNRMRWEPVLAVLTV